MLRQAANLGWSSHFRRTRIWKIVTWKTGQPKRTQQKSFYPSRYSTGTKRFFMSRDFIMEPVLKEFADLRAEKRVPLKDASPKMVQWWLSLAPRGKLHGWAVSWRSMSISHGQKYWLNQAHQARICWILLIFPLTNRYSFKLGKLVLP